MTVRYSHKIHRLFNRREELIDKPTLTPEEQAEYDAISEKLDALPTCKDPDDQAAMDLIRRAAAHLKKHMPLEAALAESAATIAALQSDNAALREALEPFAAVQEAIGQAGYTNFDATKCHITVSLGDLRRFVVIFKQDELPEVDQRLRVLLRALEEVGGA